MKKLILVLLLVPALFMPCCDNGSDGSGGNGDNMAKFKIDGTEYVFEPGDAACAYASYYTVSENTIMYAIMDCSSRAVMNNSLYITIPGNTEGTFGASDIALSINITGTTSDDYTYAAGDFSLTIDSYGNVGEQVKGHFSGTLRKNNIVDVTVTGGYFSLERTEDQPY